MPVQVVDVLSDSEALLPWDDGELSEQDRKKLGGLLPIVKPLLHRDPARRGTVTAFRHLLDGLLEQEG